MIARLLLGLLLVQALAVALAWYAAQHVLGPGPALLLACAMLLLVRVLITVQHFFLSWRLGSATPAPLRLRPWPAGRMIAAEAAATLLTSSWTMLRPGPALHLAEHARALPVLLIHGYACNHGFWQPLCARLRRAGITHAGVSLEPIDAAIEDYLPGVQQAIGDLCRVSGSAQVIIVAHSMGGLVARAWLREYGRAQVARIITLGTPHHGTLLASLGPGANARQMRRSRVASAGENAWLRALAAGESPAERALITSIFSHHDNIVVPQNSAILPGAKNIELGGIGHVGLGRQQRSLDCVMAEIDAVMTTT